MATFLSVDCTQHKVLTLHSGALDPLLQAFSSNATEIRRFARVCLGKLLCATGDELDERVGVVAARLRTGESAAALSEQICAGFLAANEAAEPQARCTTCPLAEVFDSMAEEGSALSVSQDGSFRQFQSMS